MLTERRPQSLMWAYLMVKMTVKLSAVKVTQRVIRAYKSRSMPWTGHVARMVETRNARTTLVGKPEWKSPL